MTTTARRALVFGGSGCIGSATVQELLRADSTTVTVASRTGGVGSLPLWLSEPALAGVQRESVDVADGAAVTRLCASVRPTHILHLGALQSPDCDRDPERGLSVNVAGTRNVLVAAEACGSTERLVFASSAAVYGLRECYASATVAEGVELMPPNLYGVWKLASEQLVRQFQERTGIDSLCLRLNTTYGKGRDQGKTSATTQAIKAVAAGAVRGATEAFRMPYGGRENYHFVQDVGVHFARAALDPFAGYGAFNIRGETVAVSAFLTLIGAAAEQLGLAKFVDLGVAHDAAPNPFVCDLDESAILSRFPGLPRTALSDGISTSLQAFVDLAKRGPLS